MASNLSFTSSRDPEARGNQVWLLDRSGGEAMQLTEIKGRLQITNGRLTRSVWHW